MEDYISDSSRKDWGWRVVCVCGEGMSSYRNCNIEKNTLFLCGILVSKELGAKVHELRRTFIGLVP